MTRQNLFADSPWDGEDAETGTFHRIFLRPDDARMGATLWELRPGAPGHKLHMHYGAEEMFFVVSGRPVFRSPDGEEQLAPGDFVFCLEGRAGLHTFRNPHDEPARMLAMSAGSSPTSSPTRSTSTRGLRRGIPISPPATIRGSSSGSISE
jgi:mannose-6-phosphate isomerase-like protein (cupin superfamily)